MRNVGRHKGAAGDEADYARHPVVRLARRRIAGFDGDPGGRLSGRLSRNFIHVSCDKRPPKLCPPRPFGGTDGFIHQRDTRAGVRVCVHLVEDWLDRGSMAGRGRGVRRCGLDTAPIGKKRSRSDQYVGVGLELAALFRTGDAHARNVGLIGGC